MGTRAPTREKKGASRARHGGREKERGRELPDRAPRGSRIFFFEEPSISRPYCHPTTLRKNDDQKDGGRKKRWKGDEWHRTLTAEPYHYPIRHKVIYSTKGAFMSAREGKERR